MCVCVCVRAPIFRMISFPFHFNDYHKNAGFIAKRRNLVPNYNKTN